MSLVDLVIRGGEVFDGNGGAPFVGDVAVDGGRIVGVGAGDWRGREEIDARGLMVTPGWVDIHTHYDGQMTWDERMTPSSTLGATTILAGNCGVGFAPARRDDHEVLIRLMEGVEDIPGAALHEGLQWNWESFPEFLDAVDARSRDIDVAAQVPHGALRVYVMGDRGARREPATTEEIARMGALVREAVSAGALGFSTSRTLIHRTADGDLTPTLGAAREEMVGIARGLGEAGAGVIQVASDFAELQQEFDLMCELTEVSGRQLTFSLVQPDMAPDRWREMLDLVDRAQERGVPIKAQVAGRPVGLMLGLQGSVHPFVSRPSYQAIKDLSLADKVATMRDPAFRARLIAEAPLRGHPFINALAGAHHKMFVLGDPPNYEPDPADSLGARAKALGVNPDELVYDALLGDDGRAFLFFPLANYVEGDLEPVRQMLEHPHTLSGLSDGGAHVGAICDVSLPTTMLTHWCRDRARGPRLDLASVIRGQTRDTAEAVGLFDRGRIESGYLADINLIDFARLRLGAPYMVYDLPTGARRLMQDAEGYAATIKSGQVIYRQGRPTGALPGKLVRGRQAAPVALAAE
jgi:N-acyl-D-aspartate/D-glutamate deacylase